MNIAWHTHPLHPRPPPSPQIYWLNCGLARWDALNNVPVFQSFWILVSVVGGGVFYSEFSSFTVLQVWKCVPGGRALVGGGGGRVCL